GARPPRRPAALGERRSSPRPHALRAERNAVAPRRRAVAVAVSVSVSVSVSESESESGRDARSQIEASAVLGPFKDEACGLAAFGGCFAILERPCAPRCGGFAFASA